MELAHRIRDMFVRLGYQWRYQRGGDSVLDTPTVDDIDSYIEVASGQLDNNAGSWVESGRLLIKNDYGHKDIYVHIGTINNEENNND